MNDLPTVSTEVLARMLREYNAGSQFYAGNQPALQHISEQISIVTELLALRAEVERLREALKFYAEPTNYKGEFMAGHSDYGTYTLGHFANAVRRDSGKIASTALTPAQEGGE